MKSRQVVLGALLMAAALMTVLPMLSGFLRPETAAGQTSAAYTGSQANFFQPGVGSNPFVSGPRAPQDPEARKLYEAECKAEQEVAKLVAEYAKTEEEAERAKLKTKLTDALSKQFDLQQKRRERELARVEAQLKKLRDLMKKRSDERKSIIEKRVDQLVRDAEGLGWSPPAGLRPQAAPLGVPGTPQTR
jgi:hypothetical protein